PLNGKTVARHLADAFCKLDPKSCDYFKANLKSFEDRLDAKMAEWQKLQAPYKGKQVVTYHSYWIYFGNRFDLPMEMFLEPKPGTPPPPAHLAEVITRMKADGVKVIVVQPYQNRKTAETVAGHTGAVVVDFPSFPAAGQSYLDWLDGLVKALANG